MAYALEKLLRDPDTKKALNKDDYIWINKFASDLKDRVLEPVIVLEKKGRKETEDFTASLAKSGLTEVAQRIRNRIQELDGLKTKTAAFREMKNAHLKNVMQVQLLSRWVQTLSNFLPSASKRLSAELQKKKDEMEARQPVLKRMGSELDQEFSLMSPFILMVDQEIWAEDVETNPSLKDLPLFSNLIRTGRPARLRILFFDAKDRWHDYVFISLIALGPL